MSKLKWNKKSSEAWKNAWDTENIGSSLGSIGEGLSGVISAGISNAQIEDTTEERADIEDIKTTQFSSGSFDNLLESFDVNNLARTNFTGEELRGLTAGQMVGNTLSGMGSGAIAGAQVGGPWGCVCAGTRVITNSGKIVNIEDLTKEEGILGFDKKIVKNSIFAFKPIDFKECVKITFNNGLFLECSVDHPIYTAKQGRASRKTLNGVRKRIKEYSFIEAKDLKVGDNIGCVISIPYFGNKQLPNAYLIGMLIGDGSYGKSKPVRLFTGDTDTWEYIEKNNLGVCISKDTCRYSKEFRTYKILGGCSLLKNLGIYGQTKLNKTLPHNIHEYDKESICDLLAGLFDTDGCVCYNEDNPKNGRIEFAQSNLNLIKNIQEQLIKLGIYSYIITNKPKKSYINNRDVFSKENYKLIIKDKESVINFYNNIHLNISYKKQHLELFYKYKISKHSKNNLESGVRNCKIVKIENIGIKPIYNLQADDSHTYIANFIITHNSLAGAAAGLVSGLTGIFTGNRKANREAGRLNALAEKANSEYLGSFNNAVQNTKNTMFNNSLLNIASYGGPLFNLSGEFSNGLTFINEGGTHEQNPFDGVMVGVDQEGTPNLVEEGEIIYNDYVFSNRLKPTKKQLADGGFTDKYNDWTFAKIVEDLQKESSERPNDIISKAGLDDMLSRIMTMQEEIRMKKESKNNTYKYGGPKGNILKGTGKLPNFVDVVEEEVGPEESDSLIESFWGAAKTPEQRLSVMELDPTNAYQKPKQSDKLPWQSGLRYASPLMHGITLLNNLKKPDYSNADRIESAAREIPGGSFTPIGDYLDLQEIDRNVLVNPILANAAANRRAIQNQGLNAGQAIAGLVANNYNTNNAIGNALIQGIQANNQIKSTEAQFNRGTNQANAQMGLQALAMDQQRAQNILNATAQAGQLRDQLDSARSQAISSSLTGIADDLGSIGREFMDRDLMKKLVESVALKWSGKNGGMLTRRRK